MLALVHIYHDFVNSAIVIVLTLVRFESRLVLKIYNMASNVSLKPVKDSKAKPKYKPTPGDKNPWDLDSNPLL